MSYNTHGKCMEIHSNYVSFAQDGKRIMHLTISMHPCATMYFMFCNDWGVPCEVVCEYISENADLCWSVVRMTKRF